MFKLLFSMQQNLIDRLRKKIHKTAVKVTIYSKSSEFSQLYLLKYVMVINM